MIEDKVPLVGQFSGPSENAFRAPASLPRKQVVASGVPGADKLVEELKNDSTKVESTEEVATRPKTPKEKETEYLTGLAAVGVPAVEARSILEAVLVKDQYVETFRMGPLAVTLTTRNYADVLRTLRYLELEKPTYSLGINDLVARYNMAASLVGYGDHKFEHPSKKTGATDEEVDVAFHVRLAFILELPVVAVNKLMQLTHDFDKKIEAVFADGAPEDF